MSPVKNPQFNWLSTYVLWISVTIQSGVFGWSLLSGAIYCFGLHPVILLYLGNCLYDQRHLYGDEVSSYWRSVGFHWDHHQKYYNAELLKTAELRVEDGPYVLGLHPHGIFVASVLPMFATEACGVSNKFPGIDIRIAISNALFYVPYLRDLCLRCGFLSADKEALLYNLNKGRSVVVVVGGVDEALLMGDRRPGMQKLRLVLKDRKGFVKTALETGSRLVPMLTFGENETHHQILSPIVRRFQNFLNRWTGVSIPILKPSGLIGAMFPLMPRRVKLTTIVGSPVELVDGIRRISASDPRFNDIVDEYHTRYCEALIELHAKNKEQFGHPSEQVLELVSADQARSLMLDAEETYDVGRSRL